MKTPKIRLIGMGIKGFAQLTLEGVGAIRRASKVLYVGIPDEFYRSLGIQNDENLLPLYRDGDSDLANYQRIFDKILTEASTQQDVAVLLPGHPRLGVSLAQWLSEAQAKGLIELEVTVAPSSFDGMFNDLARDPLEKGSVIIDANRLLLFNLMPDPSLDLYIYHVCSVGAAKTHYLDPSRDNQIALLRDHLLTLFPADWGVSLIRSAEKVNEAPKILTIPLSELADAVMEIRFSTTLFIPGMKPKQVRKAFLDLIRPPAPPVAPGIV